MNTEEIKFLKKLGKKIKKERKKQGLTQKFLAEKSGMNRSSLMRIEKSERNPTIISLYKIAKVLQVEIHELINLND